MACIALTALAAWLLGSRVSGIDDAYIFFVYAANVADGFGFVYNPGGERVEGFSSFSWVLVLSAMFLAGFGIPAVFVITALLAASGLYALTTALQRALPLQDGVPVLLVLAAAWMLAVPGWFLWNVASLMDLAIWTCLLSWALALFIRDVYADECREQWPAALVYALLILTRPEALAWVPFLLLSLCLHARYRGLHWRRLMMLPLIASVAALLCLLLFRLWYFGYPLPNTYYAKVSPDMVYNLEGGLRYLTDYLTGAGFAGLGVLAAVMLFLYRVPRLVALVGGRVSGFTRAQFVSTFLAAAIVLALFITAVKGGDHFGGARFLKPIYAWIFLLLAFLALAFRPDWAGSSVSRGKALAYLLIATLVFAIPVRGAWYNIDRTGIWQEFEVASEGRATAVQLAAELQQRGVTELPVVGVTGAGGFNYEWQGDVFDLMGLNDLRLAHTAGDRKGYSGHAAFDAEVFFARQPEIILPHLEGWPGVVLDCGELQDVASFYGRVLDGLQAMPKFTDAYRFVSLDSPDGRLCMYARRDYARQIGIAD